MKKLTTLFLVLFFVNYSCSSSTSSNNSTSDHNVSRGGVNHKTGLNDPLTNCVECHGDDLRGGTSGVSCFSCHGQKW